MKNRKYIPAEYMNRAYKAIKFLYNAPNKTLTEYELNTLLHTNWSPRAINEAKKINGVAISGNNPYTLVSWPEKMFPPKLVFDSAKQVYYYPSQPVQQELI